MPTTSPILTRLLEQPDAPTLVAEAQAILEAERERRLQFYNDITESEKAEFINGEVVVHSPVKLEHNDANGNLLRMIKAYVVEHSLGYVGFEKVLIALTRNDYEPDLCFFPTKVYSQLDRKQTIFPAPDFVVEILSSGTAKRDRGIKYDDYEKHGVQEYWIIDPDKQALEQYLLDSKGNYELYLKAQSGYVEARAIKGLKLPIEAIFDDRLAHETVKAMYR